MPRQRKTNAGLPSRVYKKHGGYYFVPRAPMRDPASGKMKAWLLLCRVDDGLPALYAALGRLLGDKKATAGSMPFACAEFKANKLGRYEEETRDTYGRYLDVMAAAFADFHAAQVTTKDCADFLRAKYGDKDNSARKVAALMKKMFKYIIGVLGLRQDNPMDQIDLGEYELSRRTVLATHEQIQLIRAGGMQGKLRKGAASTVATASGPMFACIIDMSYLLWARAIDIRTLRESQIIKTGGVDSHIRIKPSKTEKTSGKMVDIAITSDIEAVIERARAIKRQYEVISPYLFPTQKGTAYTKSGLSTMWRRAKERSGITDDVVFKDIRALGATDAAKRGEDRKNIQTRLAHTSGKTTDIYIKESIPEVSEIPMSLPWLAGTTENPSESN